MIYFTSDQHYGDDYIRKYWKRPAGLDALLIKNYNEIVKPDDMVFVLGDFCHSKPEEYIKQLNGKLIFIKGTHDDCMPDVKIVNAILNYPAGKVCLTHNPVDIDLRYKLHFVGHIHNMWRIWRHEDYILANVSVDMWDWKPTSYEQIMERIKSGESQVRNVI